MLTTGTCRGSEYDVVLSDNAKHESRKLVGHTSVFLGWAQEFLSYGYNDVCQNGAPRVSVSKTYLRELCGIA